MKINLIIDNTKYSTFNDVTIIKNQLFRHFKNRVSLDIVNLLNNKINIADINIFINIANYTYLRFAPINILLINLPKFNKNWKYQLDNFNYIITKNTYDYNILNKIINKEKTKLLNINWKSNDIYLNGISKTDEWLVINGISNNKHLELIINIWKRNPSFPTLNILNHNIKYNTNECTNINNITKYLSEEELIKLQNKCNFHIHLNNNISFNYSIYQSLSCKSIIMTLKNVLLDIDNNLLIDKYTKKTNKHKYGSIYSLDENILESELQNIINKLDTYDLNEIQQKNREYYLKHSNNFNECFKQVFHTIFSDNQTKIKQYPSIISQRQIEMENISKNLPKISVVILTYKREHMLQLLIWNINNTSYPKAKIEWIIVDDSPNNEDNNIKQTLDKYDNVKYVLLDKKYNIGEKRNIGVKNCTNDIICFMDDDDYYPYNSIKYRVIELLLSKKECCGITSFGCFQINNLVSIYKINDINLTLGERLSPASLCFKKQFWEQKNIDDNKNVNELTNFIRERETNVHEIMDNGVLVSLLHNFNYKNNKKTFKIPEEPNGCHFGWSDELFIMITNLDIEKEKN